MSHIHLPDGILPVWVWVTGWIIALAWIFIANRIASSKPDILRKLPLLAVMSAFMLVAMSLEIVPLAYHVNLSVLAGTLIGPLLSPIAALIIEIVLAFVGHGGITVAGINLVLVALEMTIGSLLFRAFVKLFGTKHIGLIGGIVTVITLAISTTLMLGVVSTISGSIPSHAAGVVSLKVFARTVYVLGPIGWLIEATLTGFILRYIASVRPNLLTGIMTKEGGRHENHND